MFFTSIFSTAWVRTQHTNEQKGIAMHVLANSWRRSVAATITAALLGPLSTAAEAADPPEGDPHDVEIERVVSADVLVDDVLVDDVYTDVSRHDEDQDDRLPERVEVPIRRGERDDASDDTERGLLWQKRVQDMEAKALQQHQKALKQLQEAQQRHQQAIQRAVAQAQQKIKELAAQENPDARAIRQALQSELALRHVALQMEKEASRLAQPRPDDEWQIRRKHVLAAIENLHAAGLHDQADRLEREFDRRESADAAVWRDGGPSEESSPRGKGEGDALLGGPTSLSGPPPAPRSKKLVWQEDVLIHRDPFKPQIAPFPGPPSAPPRDVIMRRSDEEVSRLRSELDSVRDEMHEMREMLHQLLDRQARHQDEADENITKEHVSRFEADEDRQAEGKHDGGGDGDRNVPKNDDGDDDRHDE
jgi:hypothetical protein